MLIHLPVLFMCFIACSYSQTNTINKACGAFDSTCGAGQACVNGRCECDPIQRRFWAGDTYECRVCPQSYYRQPDRCYKFYSTPKNHSAARADCRRDQADLFSWRDNSDESELITASTAQWYSISQSVLEQLYSWGGGMINHGRGSIADYTITWFDPKGPIIHHPALNDPFVDRFCNGLQIANYKGDPEPTRQTKDGETENCVSFVFLPQQNSRGQICMADDYCSTEMSYICELTEATISGLYQPLPTPDTVTNAPVDQPSYVVVPTNVNVKTSTVIGMPSALGEDEDEDSNQSNILFYAIGCIVFLGIVGAIAFIIIRKRKQNNTDMEVSPANSMADSNASDADMYNNA